MKSAGADAILAGRIFTSRPRRRRVDSVSEALQLVAAAPAVYDGNVQLDGRGRMPSALAGRSRGTMFLTFNERASDSPFVERIWRSRSHSAGVFLSVAASHFEIAVTRHNGKLFLTARGPETKATPADCPAEGEWLGIRFKLGTFMPAFMPGDLKDRHDVTLPAATSRSFWLDGSAWEYPDFENADTFVARLVRKGIIVRDGGVEAALASYGARLPIRSTQRHFLRATGISHREVRQIERARYATTLLKRGVSILDTVYEAGYFDQAHLNRAVKTLIGQTPAEIRRGKQQLSFLYKTTLLPRIYDAHGRLAHDRIRTNHCPG
jgi:AraC-like DNA-binding protein